MKLIKVNNIRESTSLWNIIHIGFYGQRDSRDDYNKPKIFFKVSQKSFSTLEPLNGVIITSSSIRNKIWS